jgi:protein phosphatase
MVLLPLKNMHIEYAEKTDVGKVRSANEDCQGNIRTKEGHVFVVADGMGGHRGGATASALAVTFILEYMSKPVGANPAEAIAEAIRFANTQVFATALHDNTLHGMGATCVVLFVGHDGMAWYGHAGDSRIYMLRAGKLSRLTKDHSWVQFLVDSGEIKPEEAETHPQKNRILRALGIDEEIRPDVSAEPIVLQEGDRFLLCSDGLSGLVNDAELQQLFADGKLDETADLYIQTALDRGGNDNISVSLVRISDTGKTITLRLGSKPGKFRGKWLIALALLLLSGIGLAWWMAGSKPVTAAAKGTDTAKHKVDSARVKTKESQAPSGPDNTAPAKPKAEAGEAVQQEKPPLPQSPKPQPPDSPGATDAKPTPQAPVPPAESGKPVKK